MEVGYLLLYKNVFGLLSLYFFYVLCFYVSVIYVVFQSIYIDWDIHSKRMLWITNPLLLTLYGSFLLCVSVEWNTSARFLDDVQAGWSELIFYLFVVHLYTYVWSIAHYASQLYIFSTPWLAVYHEMTVKGNSLILFPLTLCNATHANTELCCVHLVVVSKWTGVFKLWLTPPSDLKIGTQVATQQTAPLA